MAEGKGFGIASLVFGILGILFIFNLTFLSPFFGILAIIFAVLQNKKQKTKQANAGIILGIIGIVLFVIILLLGRSPLGFTRRFVEILRDSFNWGLF